MEKKSSLSFFDELCFSIIERGDTRPMEVSVMALSESSKFLIIVDIVFAIPSSASLSFIIRPTILLRRTSS